MIEVEEFEVEEQKLMLPTRKTPLSMFADAALRAEKVRVAAQVRLAHLHRRGQTCADTEELLRRARDFETWVDGKLVERLVEHPTYWWVSRVKGTGKEVIAKVLGRIEAFGRYYDVGHPDIPPEVTRDPEESLVIDRDGNTITTKVGIWVEGIERLITPSKQKVLIGHAPGLRRERGKMSPYDAELKMLFFRLGTSLMRARGKFYQFYLDYKNYLIRREEARGTRIIPTPSERYCASCDKMVMKKAAKFCPDCGETLSLKKEPPGVLYQGHLHRMAQRRMQQLFSCLLNVVWRQALGLSTRTPYAVEFLGHSRVINPEDMVDRQ